MAQIVLITAANQVKGKIQRAHLLGDRPPQWCQEKLKLGPDPIPLETKIWLTPNKGDDQHVFVKVSRSEMGPLQPGLYPSDMTPAAVREPLRDL